MKGIACFSALFLAIATSATAAGFVFGIGADGIGGQGTESTAIQLEYHTDPIREYRWGAISGMVVTQVDTDKDTYFGVGLSALSDISEKWFLESSLAVGYYDQGASGTNLGGNLQFRTLLGVGYRVSDTSQISLAIDHISNAGIEKFNPGRETVSIRYSKSF